MEKAHKLRGGGIFFLFFCAGGREVSASTCFEAPVSKGTSAMLPEGAGG